MVNSRFKFRAWNKRDKKMIYNAEDVYDGSLSGWCGVDKENNNDGWISCFGEYLGREEYVVMQCTGLKDKNGKLIYEGDLLRYPAKDKYEQENYACLEVFFHDNDCCDNHIGFQLGRVHFHGCLCGMSFGSKYKFIPKNANEMEIIGNIYQNKELLEEDKNENKSKRLNFVKGCAE